MVPLTTTDRALILYSLAKNSPDALQAAVNRMKAGGLAGLGATDTEVVATATTEQSWFDKLTEAAKALGAYITSRDLAKINLERAKKGQPPISADSIAPQVQVGLSPETRQLVTFGLLGLGVILLLRMRR